MYNSTVLTGSDYGTNDHEEGPSFLLTDTLGKFLHGYHLLSNQEPTVQDDHHLCTFHLDKNQYWKICDEITPRQKRFCLGNNQIREDIAYGFITGKEID